MEPEVLGAAIAAAVALVGTTVTWLQARSATARAQAASAELERLKVDLRRETAESDARRDYEYEAKKRLYAELGPLFFQLTELADAASNEIAKLCRPEHWERLAMTPTRREQLERAGWIGSTSYDVAYAAYALLAPLASYRFIQRRLTTLDLVVDQRVLSQWVLVRALYESFSRDDELARQGEPLDYDPRVPRWRALRRTVPQKHWWQGVTRGRLDNAVSVIVDNSTSHGRVITFGEFEEVFGEAADGGPNEKPLGAFSNALFDFRAAERPVYWRLLAVQAVLHRAIFTIGMDYGRQPTAETVAAMLRLDLELWHQFDVGEHGEPIDELARAVDSYLAEYVLPAFVAAPVRGSVDDPSDRSRSGRRRSGGADPAPAA